MSIFWRCAAREWRSSSDGIASAVGLGEYYEPIRQFLLGGSFPGDVAVSPFVHNLKPAMNAAMTVLSANGQTTEFLWFCLNSISFKVHSGKEIPEQTHLL